MQEEPREELFTIKLDVAYLRNERILERKLRPWLERKIDLHMGGQASDLVELIIRRVNGCQQPDPLIAELEKFLDDVAEPLVERLWRMLALEMIQNGFVSPAWRSARRRRRSRMRSSERTKEQETLKENGHPRSFPMLFDAYSSSRGPLLARKSSAFQCFSGFSSFSPSFFPWVDASTRRRARCRRPSWGPMC